MVADLVAALRVSPAALQPAFRADLAEATSDEARSRVIIDQVASLTDPSAVAWHARLC